MKRSGGKPVPALAAEIEQHPLHRLDCISIKIERDKETGSWVTYVPELNNISTFGPTVQAALDRTSEMILGWMAEMERSRFRIPLTKAEIAEIRSTQPETLPPPESQYPALDGKQVIRVLESLGFYVAGIEGSHHDLKKAGWRSIVTVPVHGHEPVPKGTMRSIFAQSASRERISIGRTGASAVTSPAYVGTLTAARRAVPLQQ